MNKKGLLLAGSLLSISAVSVVAFAGFNANDSFAFANGQQTNAEYSIATWEYEGWHQNASIAGYKENGTFFMFHSTSNGADPGVIVRDDIKLAVIIIQDQDYGEIEETLQYSFDGYRPSILHNQNSVFVDDSHNNPMWHSYYIDIYKVRILVGNLTFDEERNMLIENEAPNNFTQKSIFVNTTLTYSDYGDEQPGYWETFDHEYPCLFTSNYTIIDRSENNYPRTGIKIGTIMVTYGCSY